MPKLCQRLVLHELINLIGDQGLADEVFRPESASMASANSPLNRSLPKHQLVTCLALCLTCTLDLAIVVSYCHMAIQMYLVDVEVYAEKGLPDLNGG